MRTGALSCITHRGDLLSLAYVLAFADKDFREVGILGFDLLAMVQYERPALTVDRFYNCVSRRLDRGSKRFGNVQPRVVFLFAGPRRRADPNSRDDRPADWPFGGERVDHLLKLSIENAEKPL